MKQIEVLWGNCYTWISLETRSLGWCAGGETQAGFRTALQTVSTRRSLTFWELSAEDIIKHRCLSSTLHRKIQGTTLVSFTKVSWHAPWGRIVGCCSQLRADLNPGFSVSTQLRRNSLWSFLWDETKFHPRFSLPQSSSNMTLQIFANMYISSATTNSK